VDSPGPADDPKDYGNAKIVLNPDVKERSTVTLGDSLDTFTGDWTSKFGDTTAPLLASDPNPKDIFYPTQIDSIPDRLNNEENPFSTNLNPSYMEAQIHGGLTVGDIARVEFYAPPAPEVAAALDAKGVPYKVVGYLGILKGDVKGHPFHGNQWTGGLGEGHAEKAKAVQNAITNNGEITDSAKNPNHPDAIAAKIEVATNLANRISEKYGDKFDKVMRQMLTSNERKLATTPESIRTKAVGKIIGSWAKSSMNGQARTLAIQQAAVDEFGLHDTATSVPEAITGYHQYMLDNENYPNRQERYDAATAEIQQDFDKHYAKYGELYRAVLRAQYDETQAFFQKANVSEIPVWRGYQWGADKTPEWAQNGVQEVPMRPLNSFSYQPSTAYGFAEANKWLPLERAVISATVPVTSVLSCARTGFGCLNEQEVVVLGGNLPFTVNRDTANIPTDIQKGDLPGHPFRGNQWTDGTSGASKFFGMCAGGKAGWNADERKSYAANLKAKVCSDLASRMEASGARVPAHSLIAPLYDRRNEYGGYDSAEGDYSHLLTADNQFAVQNDALFLLKSDIQPPEGSTVYQGDDPALKTAIYNAATRNIVGAWAESSDSVLSQFVKGAVGEVLGSQMNREVPAPATSAYTDNRDIFHAFVQAQYDATQQLLSENGITHITLNRGWGWDLAWDAAPRWTENLTQTPQDRTAYVSPISSWAADGVTANSFANRFDDAEQPLCVVTTATFPATQIFATCLSGLGCLGEHEVIPLGGDVKVKAVALRDPFDTEEDPYDNEDEGYEE